MQVYAHLQLHTVRCVKYMYACMGMDDANCLCLLSPTSPTTTLPRSPYAAVRLIVATSVPCVHLHRLTWQRRKGEVEGDVERLAPR
jgi:hypothetical protein